MDPSAWWQKYPLPPGWQMEYDFTSKRYFYIDHANKITSWEDPRPKYYSASQHGPQQVGTRQDTHENAAQLLGSINSASGGGGGAGAVSAASSSSTSTPHDPRRSGGAGQPVQMELTASQRVPSPKPGGARAPASTSISSGTTAAATKGSVAGQGQTALSRTGRQPVEEEATHIVSHDQEGTGQLFVEVQARRIRSKFPNVEMTEIFQLLQSNNDSASKVEELLEKRENERKFQQEINLQAIKFHADFKNFSVNEITGVLKECGGRVYSARDRLENMQRELAKNKGTTGSCQPQPVRTPGSGVTAVSSGATGDRTTSSTLPSVTTSGQNVTQPARQPAASSAASLGQPSTFTKPTTAVTGTSSVGREKPRATNARTAQLPKQSGTQHQDRHPTHAAGPNSALHCGPDPGLYHGPNSALRTGPGETSVRSYVANGPNADLCCGSQQRFHRGPAAAAAAVPAPLSAAGAR